VRVSRGGRKPFRKRTDAPDKPTTRAGNTSLLAGQPQSTNIASPPSKSRRFSRLPGAINGPVDDRLRGTQELLWRGDLVSQRRSDGNNQSILGEVPERRIRGTDPDGREAEFCA